MQKTKNGFAGLIFLVIGIAFILFWFVYLWNHNWFSGKLSIPSNALNDSTTIDANQSPKAINEQLNDLRQDVKTLQDKKDKEIIDELNK